MKVNEQAKAEPKFFSHEEIVNHFTHNPHRLLEYVASGVNPKPKRQVHPVLGVHISQLAKMVGMIPMIGNQEFPDLPKVFISPLKFTNIREILQAATALQPLPMTFRLAERYKAMM
jgi:hypothetical protein